MGDWARGRSGLLQGYFECSRCAESRKRRHGVCEYFCEAGNLAEVGAPPFAVARNRFSKRAQVVLVYTPGLANGRGLVVGPALAAVTIAYVQEEGRKPECDAAWRHAVAR